VRTFNVNANHSQKVKANANELQYHALDCDLLHQLGIPEPDNFKPNYPGSKGCCEIAAAHNPSAEQDHGSPGASLRSKAGCLEIDYDQSITRFWNSIVSNSRLALTSDAAVATSICGRIIHSSVQAAPERSFS